LVGARKGYSLRFREDVNRLRKERKGESEDSVVHNGDSKGRIGGTDKLE